LKPIQPGQPRYRQGIQTAFHVECAEKGTSPPGKK
jgi:hypothetical protein